MTTKHEVADSLGSGLRSELAMLLQGGQAHATFDSAVKDFPASLRGVVPEGLPYSAWQILDHMRLAQRDILDYSRNGDGSYVPRKWPESYWLVSPEPPDSHAWESAIHEIGKDQKTFEALLTASSDAQLIEPFSWGDGQNLLHEAFLIAAHMSYHTGELIVLCRLLGAWKK
jgi:uncharacterized damage-inducible protein DinB